MTTERERASLVLHSAIAQVNKTMQEAGLAGACMLISPDEAAFTYNFAAPWSAFEADPAAQFGFRFALNAKRDGVAETLGRAEGSAHIVCQLDDFGTQTRFWMADMKKMLADNGVDFTHTSFNGATLRHIVSRSVTRSRSPAGRRRP